MRGISLDSMTEAEGVRQVVADSISRLSRHGPGG